MIPGRAFAAWLWLAAAVTAAETPLLAFEDPAAASRIAANASAANPAEDTAFRFVRRDGERVLEVACRASAGFPGVVIRPPGAAWDLSGTAWVEAGVANPGTVAVEVWLRADNAGDWQREPWNSEKAIIPPGGSAVLRVRFGSSFGAPGYALDRAAVVRVLLFLFKPEAGGTFVVRSLAAGGP